MITRNPCVFITNIFNTVTQMDLKWYPLIHRGLKQKGRHLACDHVEYILLNTIFVSRFKFQFVQLTISDHWIGWRPDTEWWKAITWSNDDTCYASQGLMKYYRYINALRPIQSGQHLQTTYWWTLKKLNMSCHGNAFGITDPLWWESIGQQGIPVTKGQQYGALIFFDVWQNILLNKHSSSL